MWFNATWAMSPGVAHTDKARLPDYQTPLDQVFQAWQGQLPWPPTSVGGLESVGANFSEGTCPSRDELLVLQSNTEDASASDDFAFLSAYVKPLGEDMWTTYSATQAQPSERINELVNPSCHLCGISLKNPSTAK